MIAVVRNGECKLMSESGAFLHQVKADGVTEAHLNDAQQLVVLTLDDGSVEIRSVVGSFEHRVAQSGARGARFSGDVVQVSMRDGSVELRNYNGSFVRRM